jgi:ribosome-binding protein aMBF1 (putative translation factor)
MRHLVLFEKYMEVDSKDRMRISDIIDKAKGDDSKEKQLAQTMANKIKDYDKAIRRGRAAEEEGQKELAEIFFARAKQLR